MLIEELLQRVELLLREGWYLNVQMNIHIAFTMYVRNGHAFSLQDLDLTRLDNVFTRNSDYAAIKVRNGLLITQ
jgi:hypothetical protein